MSRVEDILERGIAPIQVPTTSVTFMGRGKWFVRMEDGMKGGGKGGRGMDW